MTATFIAMMLIGQEANASQIVTQMLAYYHEANTLAGTITMTQRNGRDQAVIQTELQFQRPNKLYLRQILQASYGQRRWLVTSDGKLFSYDPPNDFSARAKRLVESCNPGGVALDVRAIYQAAVASLGDRSTPLDAAIGRKEDLLFRRGQWATMAVKGKSQVGGVQAWTIGGDYRDYDKAAVSGTYEMVIDEQYRLLRYSEHEKVGAKIGNQTAVQDVLTVWDVNLAKDSAVRDDLFKVIG